MRAKLERILEDLKTLVRSEEASELSEEVIVGIKAAWADLRWFTDKVETPDTLTYKVGDVITCKLDGKEGRIRHIAPGKPSKFLIKWSDGKENRYTPEELDTIVEHGCKL